MSDEAATTAANATSTDEKGGKPDYTPPATQADLDRIIADRVSRERAKYADYDDVKSKAAEHDKLVDAQKTEAQKAAERLAAAEKRAAELEVKATRAEVAAAKGVPAELLSGSTKEELEAAADALIKFRGEQKPADKAKYVIADEGGKPKIGADDNPTPGIGTLRAAYAQAQKE